MQCQNCGKREATVSYTQIINGVKKEIKLCENCAKKLGIESVQFNLPMDFADFLSDFFEDYESELLPSFIRETARCKKCGATYENFVQTGLLGCPECYETFSDRIEPILKRLQGDIKHIGRGIKKQSTVELKKDAKSVKNKKAEENNEKDNLTMDKEEKIKELNRKLKSAIKDERYEEAAQIRDELKKLQ